MTEIIELDRYETPDVTVQLLKTGNGYAIRSSNSDTDVFRPTREDAEDLYIDIVKRMSGWA